MDQKITNALHALYEALRYEAPGLEVARCQTDLRARGFECITLPRIRAVAARRVE